MVEFEGSTSTNMRKESEDDTINHNYSANSNSLYNVIPSGLLVM